MLNFTKDIKMRKDLLKDNEMHWKTVDDNFFNGAFIGDGIQGAMIMSDSDAKSIRMLLGRYDVIEDSIIEEFEYCQPRLYVASIIIQPQAEAISREMKLNLWDGEASGVINTGAEILNWSALAEREHGVFVVSLRSNSETSKANIFVRPEWGISPSFYLQNKKTSDYSDQLPPRPEVNEKNGINIITQRHRSDGVHSIAWKVIPISANENILIAAIGVDYSKNKNDAVSKSENEALEKLRNIESKGIERSVDDNRSWWNEYNMESMLELPEDNYWQKFWWMQIYKFGCISAAKSDLLIDNLGPWTWQCDWGGIWWNLNIQLSYFPTFSANKLKNGRSFINGIDRIYKSGVFHENAVDGVGITVGRASTFNGSSDAEWAMECGNLTWVLHNYWKFWKYSGEKELGCKLFEMLADNADYLISRLVELEDGKLHMKPSRSPEYPHPEDNPFFWDTNYALMGLRWAINTLDEMGEELEIKDERSGKRMEVLEKLVDYPCDANGLKINAEQGYESSHRHYSHLLAIYPYHTMNPETGTEKEKRLIRKSLDHWQSLTVALQGYSYTGGCAMYATLGEGDIALDTLDKFKARIEPNTMYREGGGPVIETPLSGVEAINYLLLQSWNGVIRVFPAIPQRWRNLSFSGFGTELAVLVGGKRENGENILVVVENKTSESKTFKIRPNLNCDVNKVLLEGFSSFKLLEDNSTFEVSLASGSTATMSSEGKGL